MGFFANHRIIILFYLKTFCKKFLSNASFSIEWIYSQGVKEKYFVQIFVLFENIIWMPEQIAKYHQVWVGLWQFITVIIKTFRWNNKSSESMKKQNSLKSVESVIIGHWITTFQKQFCNQFQFQVKIDKITRIWYTNFIWLVPSVLGTVCMT